MRYLHDENLPVFGRRGDPRLHEAIRIARDFEERTGLKIYNMPVGHGLNPTATRNEQPEYEAYWEPYGITPASTSAVVLPTAAGAGALVPGALMSFAAAGVGSFPPLGYGQGSKSGGDWGSSGNTVFPYNWTVATVDLSAVSATTFIAGVLLGVGSPGQAASVVPNTISGALPNLIAMVARVGLVQVLVDNTTTVGHTLKVSTTATHTGQASDTGGTAYTFGTTIGVAMQAVTVSAGPLPCWCKLLAAI